MSQMLVSWRPLQGIFPQCYATAKLSPKILHSRVDVDSQAWTIVITQAFQMADLPNSCLPVT